MTGPHVAVTVPATTANLGPGFDAFGLALATPTVDGTIASLVVRTVDAVTADARVTTLGEGADELPTSDDNLVWRSLVGLCEAYDVAVPDVALRVSSGIPLERGLGSSSAAIVAGLVLGRALTGVRVGVRDLVTLATRIEGHPDNVAPALLGGLVACASGDDGRLVVRRVNPAPSLHPVALVPSGRQATTHARAVLPDALSRAEVAGQAARAGHVLGALAGVWPADPALAGDHLHEPARFAAMPASGSAVAELRAAGLHAWLSGAGPTVIALRPAERPAGPRAEADATLAAVAARHGFEIHGLVVDLAGALACAEGGCAVAGTGGCVRCPRARV